MGQPFVRGYEPGDEPGIARLITEVFGASRSIDAWRWWHFDGPGRAPFIRVLIVDGEVAGHLGNVYFPTFLGGRLGTVAVGSDHAIHPDHRGEGLSDLLRSHGDDAGACDLKTSFPSDRRIEFFARREREAVLPGRMTQWVRWHTADATAASRGAPIRAPLRAAINVALRGVRPFIDRPSGRLAIQKEATPRTSSGGGSTTRPAGGRCWRHGSPANSLDG